MFHHSRISSSELQCLTQPAHLQLFKLISSIQSRLPCHFFIQLIYFSSLHVKRSATMLAAFLIRSCSEKPFQTFRLKTTQTFQYYGLFSSKVKLLNNTFQNPLDYNSSAVHFSSRCTYRPWEDTRSFSLNLVPFLHCSLKVCWFSVYSMAKSNTPLLIHT